jgi:glycosyltransferase involved in cell wall biosynthesis
LIGKVFSKLTHKLIIAGYPFSKQLVAEAKLYNNVSLIKKPTNNELNGLIQNAHINVLPSFNKTGVKMKLLHSLLKGRFCITNTQGIAGSRITKGVFVADDEENFKKVINEWMPQPFTENSIKERHEILKTYNNLTNAELLNALL